MGWLVVFPDLPRGGVIRETRVVEGVTWVCLAAAESGGFAADDESKLGEAPRWVVIAYEPITKGRVRPDLPGEA